MYGHFVWAVQGNPPVQDDCRPLGQANQFMNKIYSGPILDNPFKSLLE